MKKAPNQQSIAVLGTGAVGCYYGVRLAEAGYDVRFLVRHGYDAVRADGFRLTSHLGDVELASPTLAETPEELAAHGRVDWLIVALDAHELDQLARLAQPLMTTETAALAIVGGIGIEEQVADALHRYRVFGGLGFIGVGQPRPGRIVHREFGALDIGHHGDDAEAVQEAVALWAPTVVAARPASCLVRARWHKMIWDVPFNGLSVVAGGATSGFVLETPALAAFARSVMAEILAIGNADLGKPRPAAHRRRRGSLRARHAPHGHHRELHPTGRHRVRAPPAAGRGRHVRAAGAAGPGAGGGCAADGRSGGAGAAAQSRRDVLAGVAEFSRNARLS